MVQVTGRGASGPHYHAERGNQVKEARALRQTQAGKPNKTWRVLHRVTYVERPALMGFGRDVRQLNVRDENVGIGKVLVQVNDLQQKVNQILEWINSQKS